MSGRTLLTAEHALDLTRVLGSFTTEVRVGRPQDRRRYDVALTVLASFAVVSSFVLRDAQTPLLAWAPLGFVALGLLLGVLEVRARREVHFEVCVHLQRPGGLPDRAIVHRTASALEAKLLCVTLEHLARNANP
ncbi:hypothetical protein Deima_2161 [Deinococcus maricopensis DSM 21211]|uniref:Uncharacterized protein n=1 Tax=Deinococcus maricopensis (strain DSM 21211 / LMG 22137 / NRRL B-23946 / LB-34) TaxID=709986 RepID=E8U9R2_DEIML|nr:hypothetical protein Deima_2161 [Deinococcus maricopensis DSM 21211]